MRFTDTVIIGGGQAGLAMSWCLSDRSLDHVVLERGRVAERWRSERWDSLRLLTPNWQTRLPGFRYHGPQRDGYMSMTEVVDFFERYAASFRAPIETDMSVLTVEREREHFKVETSHGTWHARHVVIATGYNDRPFVPLQARHLSERIAQIVPTQYRGPAQLRPGGVLVVGASATGIQLADEIHASGRPVTLAVGRHQRLPRTYRGRDILWWLDAMGIFDATTEEVFDADTSRSQPSLQLIGRAGRSLDVVILQQRGVKVLGRLSAVEQERVSFDDDLVATTAASDVKLAQLLLRIDAFIAGNAGGTAASHEPFEPTWPSVVCSTKRTIDLRAAGIDTVVWATGFTRRYPWLRVRVFDERGEIRHHGGITQVPGLFVLGMHFQRSRKSAFIDGVGADAAFLADAIVACRFSRKSDRVADFRLKAEARPGL